MRRWMILFWLMGSGTCILTAATGTVDSELQRVKETYRRLFLHASPRASEYELHVPFLLWLSEDYRQACPEVAAALQANRHRRAQNSVVTFHTLLQVGGIRTPVREDSCSVASPGYREHPLVYLNDHNEAVSFPAWP